MHVTPSDSPRFAVIAQTAFAVLVIGIASQVCGLSKLQAQGLPAAADAAVFFVGPDGDDRWSGTVGKASQTDGPFATLPRAQAAVREFRRSNRQRAVRFVVHGGTYYLDAPLDFGPEDSGTEAFPVTYAAAPGERVILSGGRRIRERHWNTVHGQLVWTMPVPESLGVQVRQLFVNGVRCARPRLPKQGEYRIESLPGYTGDFLRSPTKSFVFAPGNIVSTWHNLRDVEVVALTRWQDNRLPIDRIEAESRTVVFERPSLFALHSGTSPEPYWVENVFEALAVPGEWYLDRTAGLLHYLPRSDEDLPSAEVIVPRLEQILRVVGQPDAPVHDLHFQGLTFSHTEWQVPADYAASLQAGIEVPGAIQFDYAERCSVTDGTIEHVGNYGVEVGVGCSDLEIARNRLIDLGAGGIRVGHFFSWETDGNGQLTDRGRQRKASMPTGPRSRRITVADNEIAHGGRLTAGAVGVFVGDNADNRIVRNHIHDLYYSGISVGSVQDFGPNQASGNVVEHNHVHDVGQAMLSDLAGIYTCSAPGASIRFNRVHDVSRRNYGGWGIYLDEGSHDLLVQSNLVYRCQDGALFAHHNRDVVAENNIFALNQSAQIERGGVGGFELTCRRNLVYYGHGDAVGPYGSANFSREVCAFDQNLYWDTSGKPPTFGDKSLQEWQAAGQDRDSVIADPLFQDAPKGDFRLKAESPAAKLGFEPWDLSTVGPRDKGR